VTGTFEHNDSVPFDQAYWVISKKLLAGCYPGSENSEHARLQLKGLIDHGIRHVINLMESAELIWYGHAIVPYGKQLKSIARSRGLSISIDHMPIKDRWIPSRMDMCRILDRIDQCITENMPVYVHCLGGLGRTGTVVGCYLARHGINAGRALLTMIQDLRQNTSTHSLASPETNQQVDLVLSWVAGE
jgi:protein tyrosine/serine phosphatase